MSKEELLKNICSLPHLQKHKKDITNAYICANNAHVGQRRRSGEEYVVHTLRVATILADLHMPVDIVIAGILHDTLEDTDMTYEDIEKTFGKEIAFIVDGVSILGPIKYKGFEKSKHSIQKLFICSVKDIRVLFVKLADRLDNMRTLNSLPKEKQNHITKETSVIYSPIAQKLGIGKIYSEMDDLCLKYTDPEIYETLQKHIDNVANSQKVKKCVKDIQKALHETGLTTYTIQNRIKSASSLYKKIQQKEKTIDDIHDIVGVRILTETISDCYTALGALYQNWQARGDRLKDYIVVPKPNGYQSIHANIFLKDVSIDIQIRTQNMHHYAEHGFASHFIYKKQDTWIEQHFPRLENNTKDWIQQINNIEENKKAQSYLKEIHDEHLSARILVYTEKRDVIDLPKHATVLDFAYKIHSDIGNKAVGAWVNDIYKKLNTPLAHGDTVKIQIGKKTNVHDKHVHIVKTKEARTKIKKALQVKHRR